MKITLSLVCLFIALFLSSCGLLETGKVVFYTNAQVMLDCGPFNVDVFIGDKLVGSISEPYLGESYPDCANNTFSVMVEKEVGVYDYTAKMACDQNGEWNGKFKITANSCNSVFLDVNNFSKDEK